LVSVNNSSWTSSVQDDTLVVALGGDIDCSNADELHARVRTELTEVPAGQVVLDLADVTFIDSTGVRLLLKAKDEAERHGTTFVLRGLRPQAQRLLEVTGLTEHFGTGDQALGGPWPRSVP
jgi:anti-anti-sigma factor